MYRLVLTKNEYESRICLFEDDILKDIKIISDYKFTDYGKIYIATIVKKDEQNNFCFVSYEKNKNGFLSMPRKKLEKIKTGDKILVQSQGLNSEEKLTRLKEDIRLQSRYLVYLPNEKGIKFSSKIKDEKIKNDVNSILKNYSKDAGLIVRSAVASNCSHENIEKEFKLLQEIFKIKQSNIDYHIEGIIDFLLEYSDIDIEEIVYENKLHDSLNAYAFFKNYRLKKYNKDEDILNYYNIDKELKRALSRKLNLKSGANLIFDKTEALHVIDINRSSSLKSDYEINKEAIYEISRQIILRNLGGIIIVDLINMNDTKKNTLIQELAKEVFKRDKNKISTYGMNGLALYSITREKKGFELSYFYASPSLKNLEKNAYYLFLEITREMNVHNKARNKNIVLLNATYSKEMKKLFKKYGIDCEIRVDESVAEYKILEIWGENE